MMTQTEIGDAVTKKLQMKCDKNGNFILKNAIIRVSFEAGFFSYNLRTRR
jgi:hypothetical protein